MRVGLSIHVRTTLYTRLHYTAALHRLSLEARAIWIWTEVPKHEYKTAMQGCNVQLAVHVVPFVRDTETIVQAVYIECVVNMEKIYAQRAAKRSRSRFRRNAEFARKHRRLSRDVGVA